VAVNGEPIPLNGGTTMLRKKRCLRSGAGKAHARHDVADHHFLDLGGVGSMGTTTAQKNWTGLANTA